MSRVYDSKPWADKTPGVEMILFAPILLQIFPKARFVFIYRRGIENVLSQQRKFSDRAFEDMCSTWAKCMASWRLVRAKLSSAGLEINHQILDDDPHGVAAELVSFLGLEPSYADSLAEFFRTHEVERTRDAHERRRYPLALCDTGWTDQHKHNFSNICDVMMEAYGYSTDNEHFSREPTND